jgi:hypothetical protein
MQARAAVSIHAFRERCSQYCGPLRSFLVVLSPVGAEPEILRFFVVLQVGQQPLIAEIEWPRILPILMDGVVQTVNHRSRLKSFRMTPVQGFGSRTPGDSQQLTQFVNIGWTSVAHHNIAQSAFAPSFHVKCHLTHHGHTHRQRNHFRLLLQNKDR